MGRQMLDRYNCEAWLVAVAAGYWLSSGVGYLVVPRFHEWTGDVLKEDLRRQAERRRYVEPRTIARTTAEDDAVAATRTSTITGVVERIVFTAAMIAATDHALTAMAFWLGAKMAASWGRQPWKDVRPHLWDRHAFLALQTGLVSMAFAAAGGGLTLLVHAFLIQ
jgi:hypothetical protein